MDGKNISLYLNIANIYEINNQIDKAIDFLKQALKINPKFTKADQKLSLLIDYNENNNHFEEMLKK